MTDSRIVPLDVECVGFREPCGKVFAITVSEQIFYKSRNLSLPKRCPDCRKKKREVSQKEEEAKNAV